MAEEEARLAQTIMRRPQAQKVEEPPPVVIPVRGAAQSSLTDSGMQEGDLSSRRFNAKECAWRAAAGLG